MESEHEFVYALKCPKNRVTVTFLIKNNKPQFHKISQRSLEKISLSMKIFERQKL